MNTEWICPHCDRNQTSGDANYFRTYTHIGFGIPIEGALGCTVIAFRCLNSSCKKSLIQFVVHSDNKNNDGYNYNADLKKVIFNERLIPRGASIPQPEYVPDPIKADYHEACLIRDLSPKASATLSRRCIQGMIRDFAGISKGTLDAEIRALQAAIADGTADRAISAESVTAIDHVRRIGNIGAHMEKDINVIIDVDAGEAQALIELVELLLREWYVDRHQRQQRLKAVEAIRLQKDQAKLAGRTDPLALPSA